APREPAAPDAGAAPSPRGSPRRAAGFPTAQLGQPRPALANVRRRRPTARRMRPPPAAPPAIPRASPFPPASCSGGSSPMPHLARRSAAPRSLLLVRLLLGRLRTRGLLVVTRRLAAQRRRLLGAGPAHAGDRRGAAGDLDRGRLRGHVALLVAEHQLAELVERVEVTHHRRRPARRLLRL